MTNIQRLRFPLCIQLHSLPPPFLHLLLFLLLLLLLTPLRLLLFLHSPSSSSIFFFSSSFFLFFFSSSSFLFFSSSSFLFFFSSSSFFPSFSTFCSFEAVWKKWNLLLCKPSSPQSILADQNDETQKVINLLLHITFNAQLVLHVKSNLFYSAKFSDK